jgi:hypothetical protein
MSEHKITRVTSGVAKGDAQEGMKAKERFVRRAGHDLQQPLAELKLLLHEMEQDIPAARKHKLIEVMTRSVEMMQRFVVDLIDYEKLTANIAPPQSDVVSLADLFSELAETFEETGRSQHCALHFAASSANLGADRELLRQSMTRLIGNALTHGAEGRRVLVGARPVGKAVRLEVWDRGPGISPEEAEEIFLPFHQSGSGAGTAGALGLGLAIADEAARQMGARIELCSQKDKGSRFAITLPRVERRKDSLPDVDHYAEETPHKPLPLDGLDVLVAGPGADRATLEALINDWGGKVWSGESPECLKAIRDQKLAPKLAVLCGPLPKEVEVSHFADLLQRAFGSREQCILLGPERPASETLGSAHYLASPVQPARLRSLVTFLLRENAPSDAPA